MTAAAGAQAPPNVEVQFANASFETLGARRPDGTSPPNGWYTWWRGVPARGRYRAAARRAIQPAFAARRHGERRTAIRRCVANVAGARRVGPNGCGSRAGSAPRISPRAGRVCGCGLTARAIASCAFDNMEARGPHGTTPWTRYVIELPVDSGATGIVFGVLHPGTGTAWFDSLRMEVIGEARPREVASVPAFAAPPRPVEDFTRLLTDADLSLPPDEGQLRRWTR